MEQLEAVDDAVLVLRERQRGTPLLPAPRALAGIELGAEEADDDVALGHVWLDKGLAVILVFPPVDPLLELPRFEFLLVDQ